LPIAEAAPEVTRSGSRSKRDPRRQTRSRTMTVGNDAAFTVINPEQESGGPHMTRKKPTATAVEEVQHGRPSVQAEPLTKITVVLLERHAGYLGIMSVLTRMRHHKAVARTEIIRALVEFMERSGIDFSQFAAMDDMVVYLVKHFRKAAQPGRLPLLLESSLFELLAQRQNVDSAESEI
jgi:hypothetical protein